MGNGQSQRLHVCRSQTILVKLHFFAAHLSTEILEVVHHVGRSVVQDSFQHCRHVLVDGQSGVANVLLQNQLGLTLIASQRRTTIGRGSDDVLIEDVLILYIAQRIGHGFFVYISLD